MTTSVTVGARFGAFTVREILSDRARNGSRNVSVVCQCGAIRTMVASRLTRGEAQRCASCAGRSRARPASTELFWAKVDKNGPVPAACPALGPCWLWTGCRPGFGHGRLTLAGRAASAHRVSFEMHHGDVPHGLFVLHRCNVPACVNPAHLYAGTQKQNMRDRDEAGRHGAWLHPERVPRGERSGNAKLSDAEVEELRRLAVGGATQRALAQQFGIGQSQVCRIVNRQRRAS